MPVRAIGNAGKWLIAALVAASALVSAGTVRAADERAAMVWEFRSYSDFPKAATWGEHVPEVETITIISSADGTEQPALYYDSGSDRRKPLLVALHSWSFDYTQPVSIPYGLWAVRNDWVFIHPDYRGRYNNPEATASELAIQDILDALEYAKNNARIDSSRVYLAGFSGGAMTALIMAGRYPDLWTAVSAWVPIYNLADWYSYNRRFPDRHYAGNIADSCGGPPAEDAQAKEECDRRSPSAYLKGARGKDVRIYLSVGIEDDIVPPSHALRAFNDLARPEDRFTEEDIRYVDQNNQVPERLQQEVDNLLYERSGKPLLFDKISDNVTLRFFAGGHDVLFNPALHWLSRQKKED
jgi:dipeptidyl aminopeptidase/acylaminoacyl peptidase